MDNSDETRTAEVDSLLIWAIILFVIVLGIGMFGFRYIGKLNWIDSFQNTSFYISGLGPVAEMNTTGQKLFSGSYAIVSGILYLALAAYIVGKIFDLEFFKSS